MLNLVFLAHILNYSWRKWVCVWARLRRDWQNSGLNDATENLCFILERWQHESLDILTQLSLPFVNLCTSANKKNPLIPAWNVKVYVDQVAFELQQWVTYMSLCHLGVKGKFSELFKRIRLQEEQLICTDTYKTLHTMFTYVFETRLSHPKTEECDPSSSVFQLL